MPVDDEDEDFEGFDSDKSSQIDEEDMEAAELEPA